MACSHQSVYTATYCSLDTQWCFQQPVHCNTAHNSCISRPFITNNATQMCLHAVMLRSGGIEYIEPDYPRFSISMPTECGTTTNGRCKDDMGYYWQFINTNTDLVWAKQGYGGTTKKGGIIDTVRPSMLCIEPSINPIQDGQCHTHPAQQNRHISGQARL